MVPIPGGQLRMGSDRHYPEEAPARDVFVDPFLIDETPVTNAQFAAFVAATGHVTFAETAPDPADYPGMPPEMAQPGSLVFMPTSGPVDLGNPMQWWQFVFGADWRHPTGPDSSIDSLGDHPVVHIVHADAAAYAAWAGKRLPSEAEWECAARGGLDHQDYAWGAELEPDGIPQANIWRGQFPWETLDGGGFRTSPVRNYPPNRYGLHDMIGNVWEWTSDWYAEGRTATGQPCCVPRNPRGGDEASSHDPHGPAIARKVLKGGSHLCAPSYCQRYRPAARYPQPIDTSTSHVGFRCARSA